MRPAERGMMTTDKPLRRDYYVVALASLLVVAYVC